MNIEKELLKLSNIASKNGDIPVSCIIIKKNKIVAKSYNNKYYKKNPLGHAEINAIIKASKKLNTVNLSDCEMYVTLKPCSMCTNIINEMRIKKVYYYIENNKIINNTCNFIKLKNNILKNEQLSNFFQDKR